MIQKYAYVNFKLSIKKKYFENMENLIKPWLQTFEDKNKLFNFKIQLNKGVQKDLLK